MAELREMEYEVGGIKHRAQMDEREAKRRGLKWDTKAPVVEEVDTSKNRAGVQAKAEKPANKAVSVENK